MTMYYIDVPWICIVSSYLETPNYVFTGFSRFHRKCSLCSRFP